MSDRPSDFHLVQRTDFILEQCLGKSVLHLGCTNYPYTNEAVANNMLLHFELQRVAAELYGLDYEQAGIDILTASGSKNILRADLEKLDELALDRTFDVIV